MLLLPSVEKFSAATTFWSFVNQRSNEPRTLVCEVVTVVCEDLLGSVRLLLDLTHFGCLDALLMHADFLRIVIVDQYHANSWERLVPSWRIQSPVPLPDS